MVHGPTNYDSKGCCIYCGASKVTLTDEHIVPYSLGGVHVLKAASCLRCADVTKRFEQKVAQDLWGDARNSFNSPSRRKKNKKKEIFTPDSVDQSSGIFVPREEYPAGFVFYKMGKCGVLQGVNEEMDLSVFWELVVIDDEDRRKSFHRKYGRYPSIQFRHVPYDFGRMLAKIGYCQILTSLDIKDFRPICLPYILGIKNNVSYVVGGDFSDQNPEPKIGYSLNTAVFGNLDRIMLVALIRLYANTYSPAYHVVVGDVGGRENVAKIVEKVGRPRNDYNFLPSSAHWSPDIFPLPIWSKKFSV